MSSDEYVYYFQFALLLKTPLSSPPSLSLKLYNVKLRDGSFQALVLFHVKTQNISRHWHLRSSQLCQAWKYDLLGIKMGFRLIISDSSHAKMEFSSEIMMRVFGLV